MLEENLYTASGRSWLTLFTKRCKSDVRNERTTLYSYSYSEHLFKVQYMQTYLETEIVRLTLFNNFLIHNYIHYTHYCLLHILPIMRWFARRTKTGVPGEKPMKHKEINYGISTHVKYHTRLGFSGERHNRGPFLACSNLLACSNSYVKEPLTEKVIGIL